MDAVAPPSSARHIVLGSSAVSNSCPLCGSAKLFLVLERTNVPVHQNRPFPTAEAARADGRGDLRIECCQSCGFVTNSLFSEKLLRYEAGYENDQTYSAVFDQHVESLLARLVQERGVRDLEIVEVGCGGRGQFLERFCARGENRGIGFDPAYVGEPRSTDGRVRFVQEYYGEKFADVPADVVICRHVIEHVPAPLDLLTAIHSALRSKPRARLFFETPAIDWIFDNLVIQDFFYEHCSYFTDESLRYAFRTAGFNPVSVERIFGDQYLWIEAVYDPSVPPDLSLPSTDSILAAAEKFSAREKERSARLLAMVVRLRAEGPVAIWGAGAKGVTFANHLDAGSELIDCVIDINPRKQGGFLPGTGHPIVGPEDLRPRSIANVIVLNPNYTAEINAFVQANDLRIGVHTESEA